VRDVEKITSVSRTGSGNIRLRVRKGADADFVRFNVASQVRRLYPTLPAGASYPTITLAAGDRDETTDLPVMTYVLAGPADPSELYRYATEDLVPRLSLLRGLSRMEVTGGNRPHWRIELRPDRMATYGLSAAALTTHLQQYFQRGGLGFVNGDGERL
jgi:multidrug efflux pump subunit AcrB